VRIVLAGATGFLGRPLTTRLVAEGHAVTLLTRRPAAGSPVHQVEWQPDGTAGAWAGVVDGADAVVNLAGAPLAPRRWTTARKRVLIESRVLSNRSLVAAIGAAKTRPRLLISASGAGYYGPCGAQTITEAAPPGDDFLGRLVVEWEAAANQARTLGARVVTLRTALVLGEGGGALAPMLPPFRLGLGGPFGDGQQYWPWIHVDDWLALVEFALAQPSVDGPVNLTAPEPVTNEEFSRTLARVLHRPCLFRVPAFVLRLVMGELADGLLLSGQRAIPARAQALGFRFRYETAEAALRQVLGAPR
jgi:uncharacterized protein (TIGR01777 family)